MNLERYNRQTILSGFGLEAQEKLQGSKVLVVGAGGLGIPVLTYLNAMGVGTLGIVDDDVVSLSNLHRQVLYSEQDIGRPKTTVALEKLAAQNSETVLVAHQTFLTVENALRIMAGYDVIVDASDNFPTRYLVNDACVILKKRLVYGALHAFEGQVSVFNYRGGPTYRCLFPTMPKPDEVPDCNENGVLGILPGIIGNLQALETIKVITGVGEVLAGKLLLFDGLSNTFQKISFVAKAENLEIDTLRADYDFECDINFDATNGNLSDLNAVDSENADSAPVYSKNPESRSAYGNSHTFEAININDLFFDTIDAETFLGLLEVSSVPIESTNEQLASPRVQLIDVRTPAEFTRNHIEIAKNIPLSELEDRHGEIDFDTKVYVVCQSGIRSKKAIGKLLKLRPNAKLSNVEGGMNQIRKHGVAY